MRPTLFPIPDQVGGYPVFGVGLLLLGWILFSFALVAWLVRRQGFSADTRSYLPVLLIVAAAIVLVLPALVQPGEGLPIRGYGVMMLIGVVAGVGLSAWRAERHGLSADDIFSLAFWMFVAGILGARLFHVIEYWDTSYRQTMADGSLDLIATLKAIINVPRGGLVVYGSLIAGLIALAWFVRRKRLPGLVVADLIAPGMVLGLAFGRLGCLLNGCCFGGVCTLSWAIQFPQDSLPYQQQIERGLDYGIQIIGRPNSQERRSAEPASTNEASLGTRPSDQLELDPIIGWLQDDLAQQGFAVGQRIVSFGSLENPTAQQVWKLMRERENSGGVIAVVTAGDPAERFIQRTALPASSLPVQPTQIYSAINALLLCLFLLAYYPFRRRDGEAFALLITIYPITRFLLEIIRTDEAAMFGTQLSISQIVSVLLLLGVVCVWVYVLRQPAGQLWTAPAPQDARGGRRAASGRGR